MAGDNRWLSQISRSETALRKRSIGAKKVAIIDNQLVITERTP
jgi:hypothetical protein